MVAFWSPRTFPMWIVVGTCLAWAGCGGSDGPRTIPVSGKVTYKGEPVKNGVVNFFPESGQDLRGTQANCHDDGTFKTPPGKGLMVGRYRISIDAAVSDPAGESAKRATPDLAFSRKYTRPDTSGLTVAVEASDSSKTLDLELTD